MEEHAELEEKLGELKLNQYLELLISSSLTVLRGDIV